MKRIYSLIFFVLLGLSLLGQTTIQSTGYPNEQNRSFTTNELKGQTFMATQTGNITSISIKMDAAQGSNTYIGSLNLFLGLEPGDGNTIGGTPYQTFNVTAANVTGEVTINLNTPFPVVSGTIYRMEFTSSGGIFLIDVNGNDLVPNIDSYTDGVAIIQNVGTYANTANLGSEFDLNFSLTISNPLLSSPIPTMSQWGLLIFGLLILNLSIFYVQRRELI